MTAIGYIRQSRRADLDVALSYDAQLVAIQRLAAGGIAVIVISHNLNDVFAVADRVAILHLGRLVSTGPASDYDRQSAVEIMTTGALSDRENGARGAAATI